MITYYLNQGLNSNQFHAGLSEICRHFEDKRADDYMNTLLQEVENANQALFEAMHIASAKRSVQQEARLLNERLVAAMRYIDSCRYVPDAEVTASAEVLKTMFGSYGKPITRMKVDTRVGAVRVLLRDLAKPEVQVHVTKLAELQGRINGIQEALDTLTAKQLEVDQANSNQEKPVPLVGLKREASAKLEVLVAYLKAMSIKDPATYSEDYAVVSEIIKRLNATYKGGAPKASLPQPGATESEADSRLSA